LNVCTDFNNFKTLFRLPHGLLRSVVYCQPVEHSKRRAVIGKGIAIVTHHIDNASTPAFSDKHCPANIIGADIKSL